ncbi:hypothetical protein SAMN02982929_05127 [Saccharopolyspora kobensis]|uniref:Uncharacterized protein n=1 Tax=Saccharopolyspora kobensis TaxID=146035 RepID=A0A1H6DXC5_9PSEU|nr:hypothetical protein [Saccharopolyspora kobensis]SEG90000.1 hypothetical protein SAMN02982929_05127 [Saccharopolyspora kobensis]SFD88491.1 hypothetical protein SAMN05216506_107100 [Saccharopolyspora kobensis]
MTEPGQQVDAFGRPVPAPEPSAAPQSLLVARWLWIGSVLIGVVQAFIQLADRSRLISELRAVNPELSQQDLDSAANGGIMFALLLKALILMVYVMLTRRMLEGRNWSRIVLTVFGGFGVFNAFITVLTVAAFGTALVHELTGVAITWVEVLFALVVAAVEVAAIVFMFRPDANRFIREAGERFRLAKLRR